VGKSQTGTSVTFYISAEWKGISRRVEHPHRATFLCLSPFSREASASLITCILLKSIMLRGDYDSS
jgi:hypothetical protein